MLLAQIYFNTNHKFRQFKFFLTHTIFSRVKMTSIAIVYNFSTTSYLMIFFGIWHFSILLNIEPSNKYLLFIIIPDSNWWKWNRNQLCWVFYYPLSSQTKNVWLDFFSVSYNIVVLTLFNISYDPGNN